MTVMGGGVDMFLRSHGQNCATLLSFSFIYNPMSIYRSRRDHCCSGAI